MHIKESIAEPFNGPNQNVNLMGRELNDSFTGSFPSKAGKF